ncbi:MAG: hypothetical protein M3275_01970 [Thermoproteota archaeon]|nr:hypothetical protein [Thermoproteota archaeon]
MQNEEMMKTKPKSRASDNSSGQQVAGWLDPESKQFFDTTSYLLHAKSRHRKPQEKKWIDFSEIIQILRMTKLQQCKRQYHNDGKFCALGAILHEKYGWNGFSNPFGYESSSPRQQLLTILGDAVICKIASLNDDGKSFSEIADWLEKNLFKELNWTGLDLTAVYQKNGLLK